MYYKYNEEKILKFQQIHDDEWFYLYKKLGWKKTAIFPLTDA